jgi:hypothetical protein
MGDGLLQSQFGVNPHPKRAKNRVNVAKGGKANRVALTVTYTDPSVAGLTRYLFAVHSSPSLGSSR